MPKDLRSTAKDLSSEAAMDGRQLSTARVIDSEDVVFLKGKGEIVVSKRKLGQLPAR